MSKKLNKNQLKQLGWKYEVRLTGATHRYKRGSRCLLFNTENYRIRIGKYYGDHAEPELDMIIETKEQLLEQMKKLWKRL